MTNRASDLFACLSASRVVLAALMGGYLLSTPVGAVAQTSVDPRTGTDESKVVQENGVEGDNDLGAKDPYRVDRAYQPNGIELGSYLLFPTLEVGEAYNTNVFATESNKKGDFVTHIAPEFQLRSQYGQDQLNLLGRLDESVHATYSQDDHLDGTLRSEGSYSFSSQTELNGFIEISQLYEDRGSPDDKDALEPTQTRNAAANADLKEHFGRLTLSEDLTLARHDFENVSRLDSPIPLINADRNRFEVSGFLRGDYELSPGYAALAQVAANDVVYDHKFDQDGFERSNHGYRIDSGFAVDLTQVIKGDFTVGYLDQSIDDRRLPGPSGFAFRVAASWTPDRSTIIVPSIERTLNETTLSGASVAIHTVYGVLVRREIQRNFVATVSGYVYNDKFDGLGRSDWYYDTRVRGLWSFSPNYYVGAEVGYRKRNTNFDGNSFNEVVTMFRFGVRT
jgi:hypothetical protein